MYQRSWKPSCFYTVSRSKIQESTISFSDDSHAQSSSSYRNMSHMWIQVTFVVSIGIIVWLLPGCCWLVLWRRVLFLLFSLRCYHPKHCFIFIFTLCLIPLHQYMSKHSVETVIQEPNHQSNWDFSKESYALLWKPLNSRLCLVTNNLSVVS